MSRIEEMILDRDFKYLRPYFYKNKWALRCELGIGSDEAFDANAKKNARTRSITFFSRRARTL